MKIRSYIITTDDRLIPAGAAVGFICAITNILPDKDYLIKRVTWSHICRTQLGQVIPKEINESIQAELYIWNGISAPAVNETPLGLSPAPLVNFPAAPDNVLRIYETGQYNFDAIRFKNYIAIELNANNYDVIPVFFKGSIIIEIAEDEK